MDEMMLDYYTHHYAQNPNAIEDEDDTFDVDEVLAAMEEDDWETLIDAAPVS